MWSNEEREQAQLRVNLLKCAYCGGQHTMKVLGAEHMGLMSNFERTFSAACEICQHMAFFLLTK